MKYRREIDGLRAVAVVPVILFHAGLSQFSGGYVGVDVFFVISGYLITTIIIGERAEGRFSILRFYERRARRILPALFVVMAACLPFAWMWMPPEPFEDFLRSLAFAALFISNVHFWEYTGYFEQAAELRPLLHTWSLAVEEQYYLIFPLILMLMGAFRRAKHIAVIGILALLSLALSEWGWRNYPEENFFFTFSRVWELFIGSICAFIAFRREIAGNEWLSAAGLAMIVYSIFFFDAYMPFPSLYTLVPVLGTALVLLYARRGTRVARVLSVRPMVGIGLVSYSAYLWHQPLFAFARIHSVDEPEIWIMMVLAVASLALAVVTWKYVEQPFRAGPRKLLAGRPALLGASAAGIAAFAAFGFVGMGQNWAEARVESRMTPYYDTLLKSARWHDLMADCRKSQGDLPKEARVCEVFSFDAPRETIVVMGDSHADALLPAFGAYAEKHRANVLRMGVAGCPPILGVYVHRGLHRLGLCHEAAENQARFVAENDVSTVVLVARWSLYTDGSFKESGANYLLNTSRRVQGEGKAGSQKVFAQALPETVAYYRDQGARVVVVEQVPQLAINPEHAILRAMMVRRAPALAEKEFRSGLLPVSDHDRLQAQAKSVFDRLEGVEVISLSEAFRDGDRYRWFIGGRSAYADDDHVSAHGASLLQDRVMQVLERR